MTDTKLFRPSAAHRWLACPGSVAFASRPQEVVGLYAPEGTAAHFVASECLETAQDASAYANRYVLVHPAGAFSPRFDAPANPLPDGAVRFEVNEEMVHGVQEYLTRLRAMAKQSPIRPERQVAFGHLVGLTSDHTGTLDAEFIVDGELHVHDLKYGRGVKVWAERNPQLLMYAAASYNEVGWIAGVERIRLCIHQPRLGHFDEWACTPEELGHFVAQAAEAIKTARGDAPPRVPGPEQCKFCPGKAECPEYRKEVLDTVYAGGTATVEEFDAAPVPTAEYVKPATDDWLAVAMGKVDMIEQWCRAVRAEVEARLLHGVPIRGWKVVQGRRGPRAWTTEAEAEKALKAMRLKHDQMYDYKLASPTAIERLVKDKAIGARQWDKLQALIMRTEGKPSVAPESDERPAIDVSRTTDEFEDQSAGLV